MITWLPALALALGTPGPLVADSAGIAQPVVASTAGAVASTMPSPAPTPMAEAGGTTIVVSSSPLDTRRIAGSANRVGEEELERFEHDDAHRVLAQVPGVYLRDEDGYGLRPNIGMRGASSDRSQKVTLMEDGVLLAPAPYSAPAAYYFPMMSRLTAVEVYKGPAAIRFGPNTVGGAINLVSRPVPLGREAAFDIGAGEYRAAKLHARAGAGTMHRGLSVEGMHLQTDGYKKLDGGGPTGFDKNEVVARGFLGGSAAGADHRSELKLLYADEVSNETYLGLTNGDFREDPWRRYVASARDRMQWRRTSVQWTHAFAAGSFEGTIALYRNDFSRSWFKLNRFRGGPALSDVLSNPDSGQTAVYAAILRGELDSSTADEALLLGTNRRAFVSQGVQARGSTRFSTGSVQHVLELGARLHGDRIDRLHTEDPFLMQSGELVAEGTPRLTNVDQRGSAFAIAVYAQDEIRAGRFLFTPGARIESIETRHHERLADVSRRSTDAVVLPGLGAYADIGRGLGLLAGVHEGFSPVAPGQPAKVRPERSTNYEGGARWNREGSRAEVVGFFSDYRNITGECTFSGGCADDVGAQFNGGAANVWGLEALAGHAVRTPWGVELGGEASWTITESSFLTDFRSANPQWGDVRAGDELPYVPRNRGAATLRLSASRWEVAVSAAHASSMREQAGRGRPPATLRTDAYTVVDVVAHVRVNGKGELYASLENALGEEYLVSHRPFGARPGKRRDFRLGFKYRFGGQA